MTEFLNMGGHGVYIWPCYAMAGGLLIGLLLASLKALSKSKKDLSVMEQMARQGENA